VAGEAFLNQQRAYALLEEGGAVAVGREQAGPEDGEEGKQITQCMNCITADAAIE